MPTPFSTPLTIHLFSFSYRNGGIPHDEGGHGGGFVFDCRALPNPHWDEALRPHTGLEAPVRGFLEAQPEVTTFLEHVAGLVLASAATYTRLERERLMVSFGCTGGKHRSVYTASRMAEALQAAGYRVVTRHLGLEAAGTAPEAGGT